MTQQCIYCTKLFDKDTEHVFPFGLGGQGLYMDCVCEKCNNNFSSLERELYQKSPIGLIRSVEGIKGYKPSGIYPSSFKAKILLCQEKNTKIIYEVGQFFEMQIFVRPQIISVDNSFYIEGDSLKSMGYFTEKVNKWMQNGLEIIFISDDDHNKTIIIKFQNDNGNYTALHSTELKNSKKVIVLDLLSESHELFSSLAARIYIDDEKKLRMRAKTIEQATAFMIDFLNYTSNPKTLHSFSDGAIDLPVVFVGMSFNSFKCEQAMVKIGLNCLFHYFPDSKNDTAFADCVSFVNKSIPPIQAQVMKKNNLKDNVPETHNVFFHQGPNTLDIRVSLFNGQFIYSFRINGLKILQPFEYNRLLIYYKLHLHKFETRAEYLQSFH